MAFALALDIIAPNSTSRPDAAFPTSAPLLCSALPMAHGTARSHKLPSSSQLRLNTWAPIWGYAKTNPLANFAPVELRDLVMQTQLTTFVIGDDPSLRRSFCRHCPLSLRLK